MVQIGEAIGNVPTPVYDFEVLLQIVQCLEGLCACSTPLAIISIVKGNYSC